jgi:two-component system sensor histidine kinase PilS (NtrC family)
MSLEAIPLRQEAAKWRGLRLFSLYRIVIAGLLVTLSFYGVGPDILRLTNPPLFNMTSVVYLFSSLILSLMATFHKPDFTPQIRLQALLDLICLILIMHASGGVSSGLGMLLIISVGAISLIKPGRFSLFYAAVASLTLLADQIYGILIGTYTQATYTQTGILGATLFGTALLAGRIAQAAYKSELLAEKRRIDLDALSKLNEQIIEHIESGIIVIDASGRIRLINQSAWHLLGEPGMGNPQEVAHKAPEILKAYRDWRSGKGAQKLSVKLDINNQELQLRFSNLAGPEEQNNLIYLEDTGERRRIAQEMKLASLGRLTASIAHEIRNPLGAISHAAQLLDESPDLAQADKRLVSIMMDQSKRMNSVIQNILRLSRREDSQPEPIQLQDWLNQFASEFSQHHGFEPELIQISLDPEDTVVVFDPSQLHQVLWNLCSNAKKYACTNNPQTCLRLQGGIDDGDTPYLDIIDNGPGVPIELQDKLFEPFFTTNTQGVGLGLYISREMCENNSAHLEYIAMPMGGSCFRILFPKANRV